MSIRLGKCDAAIVGGSNLCLKPATALQFLKLGMLSPDGACKSFDAAGLMKFEILKVLLEMCSIYYRKFYSGYVIKIFLIWFIIAV